MLRKGPAIIMVGTVLLGGCSVFMPVTHPGPAPTPVVAISSFVPATPPTSSPSPAGSGPVDAAGFAAATCTANSDLSAGFGSPDSGVKSVAWTALDAAIAARDATRIDTTAAAVLVHIEAARVAAAHGATWTTGAPANAELLVVLSGLETYVGSVRAAHGDQTATARAAKDLEAIWPHYLAYLQLLQQLIVAKTIPLTQLPC